MKSLNHCLLTFFLGSIFLMSFNFSFAQKEKKTPVSITTEEISNVKDRFMVDFYSSLWMNVPKDVSMENNGFNEGFNFSWLWDFKTGKKSPISFGLGIGVNYYTMYTNSLLKMDYENDIAKFYILPDDIEEYKRCRLSYTNVNIPFEIRYRHSCGFKLNIGVRVGMMADLRFNYKGDDLTELKDVTMNYIEKGFLNKQKFTFEVTLKTGWKWFGINASCHVSKLFEKEKGPQMYPVSLGITLSLF